MNQLKVAITGDKHGKYRLSSLGDLREKIDILIIAGDGGLFFSSNHPYYKEYGWDKDNLIEAEWLNQQGYMCIIIGGNHENYDWIETLPQVELFGGIARQIVFDNVIYNNLYYIYEPTIMTINDKTYLFMPGADSHDIKDGIIEWDDPRRIEWSINPFRLFRINHVSWWEQERVNITAIKNLLEDKQDQYFNFIITHEGPKDYMRFYSPFWKYYFQLLRAYDNTPGEELFSRLIEDLNFDYWFFGHYHEDRKVDDKVFCLYNDIRIIDKGE